MNLKNAHCFDWILQIRCKSRFYFCIHDPMIFWGAGGGGGGLGERFRDSKTVQLISGLLCKFTCSAIFSCVRKHFHLKNDSWDNYSLPYI